MSSVTTADPQPDPVADLLRVLDVRPVGRATISTAFDDDTAGTDAGDRRESSQKAGAHGHGDRASDALESGDRTDLGSSVADVFIGESQRQPHGRIFGGQVLAQCIIAAGRTVGEITPGVPRHIHSLHAYFLRPGDDSLPVRFAVERLRDGGSFSARRVHAIQKGAPILSVIMSFQEHSDGIEHQETMPSVPAPEALPTTADVVGDIDHPVAQHWAHARPIDVRHVDSALYVAPAPQRQTSQNIWMRTLAPVLSDPLINAAILAYASDYSMLESAMRANGLAWSTPGYRAASLDHAMWFHRPVEVSQWILFSQQSPSASGGRGLGVGRMFTQDGTLVATVAQEGMMRLKDVPPA